MFKTTERKEIGQIDNIPIDFGIKYILSINEFNKPKTVDKTFGKNKGKIEQLEHVILHDFDITSRKLIVNNTDKTLQSLEVEQEYKLQLPKTLMNLFMDMIDTNDIQVKQKFSLEKIQTDNEFKPLIELKKVK